MRGRFAPSPTGRLHLGNARTALLGWLQARASSGEFLLRIEDLDRGRCRPEHTDILLRDLEYLGLFWDGPLVFQSQRGEAYEAALETLAGQGKLYPCFCSRAEVAAAASAPQGPADEGPRYGGTCRRLSPEEAARRTAQRRPQSLRFISRGGIVTFEDALHGPYHQDVSAAVGDFVVRRNDGVAAYQLAVVVDDASAGITHVLRGDDLLSSTPRQLLLHEALSLPVPRYAHVPLVVGEDGRRLAKRDGGLSVTDLRERGVPSERVVGLLSRLCGLTDGAPQSAQALVPHFSLGRLGRKPVTVRASDLSAALGL